jgi:uncharacterized LabA/DUF88 family protein
MAAETERLRLAVLIDADNANASVVEPLLAEVARFGVATVRRMYGDWTTPNLSPWKETVLTHSIHPVQQFRNTKGKNASDSALIIDAMDLLHGARVDGFCLVSSDSDFTRLAARIREQGLPVYGFGESKTPRPFVVACDRFIFTDVLMRARSESTGSSAADAPLRKLKGDNNLAALLRETVEAAADEDGWAALQVVGSRITQKLPDFDPRNYGFARLRPLVDAIGLFEISERPDSRGNKHAWLRDARSRGSTS